MGGGSRHGSRHGSGSRHESSHHRRRAERHRVAAENQMIAQKLAAQEAAPLSPLAVYSARLLHEAGEKLKPAPRSPTGRAFFVPLKHELRLEMSEKHSSVGTANGYDTEGDGDESTRSFATNSPVRRVALA